MSRTSTIEQMTVGKRKNALEFHWDTLWAPPIMSLFTPEDINELISTAKSIRYAGNIAKKYDLIDNVMKRRGFRRAHSGTNRVCYNYLESSAFVAKVAVDSVGMTDSPAEYMNQNYFKPFCCKIFEVHPSGVIAFIERVNPISSIEEFISVKDDVFNMMITKIIGKYVVDDLGSKSYMNFGVRQSSYGTSFGPVIIDFPYVYETDGAKLKCMYSVQNSMGLYEQCGGDIDYDAGFNKLQCTKCGREYRAIDLAKAKDNNEIKFEYTDKDRQFAEKIRPMIRAQIIEYDGSIIYDSGRKSKRYISKEDFKMSDCIPTGSFKVNKIHKSKRESIQDVRKRYFSELQLQYYNNLKSNEPFNPVINNTDNVEKAQIIKPNKNETFNGNPYEVQHVDGYDESEFIPDMMEEPVRKIKIRKVHFQDKEDLIINDTSNDIKEMEFNIVPEINNVVSPEDEVNDNTTEEEESTETKYEYEPRTQSQVVSDLEFQKILKQYQDANAAKDSTNDSSGDDSVINPELDTNPLNNPIIRPYGDATHSVYYSENSGTSDINELLKKTIEMESVEEDNTTEEEESEYTQEEDTYDKIERQDREKSNKKKKYVSNKRRH